MFFSFEGRLDANICFFVKCLETTAQANSLNGKGNACSFRKITNFFKWWPYAWPKQKAILGLQSEFTDSQIEPIFIDFEYSRCNYELFTKIFMLVTQKRSIYFKKFTTIESIVQH